MKFIGLNLRNHDANVSFSDGKNVKYLKFEREFSQKHFGTTDPYYLDYVLNKWNINPKEIDGIAYLIDMNIPINPYISNNTWYDTDSLYEEFKPDHWYFNKFNCPFFRIDHHYAHSLSVWPVINNTDVDLVNDALGDLEDTYTIFRKNRRVLRKDREDGLSFGVLLNLIAEDMGIEGMWQDLAGKMMGLKSYGKIDFEYINQFDNDIGELERLFNQRKYYRTKSSLEKNEINRLASCHYKAELVIIEHFKKHVNQTEVVSYSGGVAQNCVLNSKLRKFFPNLHIPPHSPDDGLSLGCIEFLRKKFNQPEFSKENFPFWQDDIRPLTNPQIDTIKKTAKLLSNGHIIGWYQGHGEIGPRALGNRSILMNPAIDNAREILNNQVKRREWFRPFGISIIEKEVENYFDFVGKSEYMLFTAQVKDKERFKSITHVDGSCRIQTVNQSHEIFYKLLMEFYSITGIPMLINTSLNINGRPIAGKPLEALELFNNSQMTSLVIGNELYIKEINDA
jgi:carbamoyltransferase